MTSVMAEALLHVPGASGLSSKAKNTSSIKKTRVQLELPPRSMERLNHLKEDTEATSYVEVIKNAIRLYEAMVKEARAGRKFLIKDPNGTIMPYNVFLDP